MFEESEEDAFWNETAKNLLQGVRLQTVIRELNDSLDAIDDFVRWLPVYKEAEEVIAKVKAL